MTSKRYQVRPDRQGNNSRDQRKHHEPSHSRELVRLAKVARTRDDLVAIIGQANSLIDPYYRASALAGIAAEMVKAGMDDPKMVFREAIESIKKVEQQWRRHEVLDTVVGKMAMAGIDDFSAAQDIVRGLTEERPRRDAFRSITREMVKASSSDPYQIMEICRDEREKVRALKDIIRAQTRIGNLDLHEMNDAVDGIKEPYHLAKARIYIGYTLASMNHPESEKHFHEALMISSHITDQVKRLDLLRHLADSLISTGDLDLGTLIEHAEAFPDPANGARLLGHMAGMLSKAGHQNADDLFERALKLCEHIEEPNVRSNALRNIATGLSKAGSPKVTEVQALLEGMESSSAPKEETRDGYIRFENGGSATPNVKGCEMGHDQRYKTGERHLSMGLFNTYEKVLGPPHVRAIARAAPLCWAYDLDLVIFGFPFRDEAEVVSKVHIDTAIGEEGKYLGELLKSGRLRLSRDISSTELEAIVSTTSRPDPRKDTPLEDILANEDRVCFVLGVGRLGLPKHVLQRSKYHLEFTGNNVPLETATAMGVLAYMLWKQTHPSQPRESR